MGMTGSVDGVGRFRATLTDAVDALSDLAPVDREVGQLLLGVIDPPRVSGALANTVRAEPDDAGVTLAAGSSDVLYAGVIHNGWPAHNITAQPFITKAIDKAESAIADRYESHADQALSLVKGA